jgi:hypothetical protein
LTVCSMFLISGWSIVRSTQLAKEGSSRKRLSLHLHKVPSQSNKVSPWTLQMVLVCYKLWIVDMEKEVEVLTIKHHSPGWCPCFEFSNFRLQILVRRAVIPNEYFQGSP